MIQQYRLVNRHCGVTFKGTLPEAKAWANRHCTIYTGLARLYCVDYKEQRMQVVATREGEGPWKTILTIIPPLVYTPSDLETIRHSW
jgi:hypothetical protein